MTDERLKKTPDAGRLDRAMQDRAVTENRAISDEDRIAMFRQQLFQSALPDLPQLPGYHVCWLSTTHPADTIPNRLRLGYEPIKPEDVAGWEFNSVKSAGIEGWISCNEMVAAKIPQNLYEAYMRINHHDNPAMEESKLEDVARRIQDEMRRKGSDVEIGDGLADMGKAARAPQAWA